MKQKLIQIVISAAAIALVVVHSVWPSWTIDGITIGLLVVAVLPWLAPLFKSVELPGGWKIEFRDLQRARDKAEQAGLLSPLGTASKAEVYPFELVAEGDPNLALAGIRIEIEKRLRELAASRNLEIQKAASIGNLLNMLSHAKVLNPGERSVLADMLGLLNSAVHGATVDPRASSWAIEVGPLLLQSLDNKISKNR